jgi:PAS domain-containing protein
MSLDTATPRSSLIEILSEAEHIPRQLQSILNSLPNVGLIINSNLEVLFANKALLSELGLGKLDDVLGKRPGEVVQCNNAVRAEMGCGTAPGCNYCGVVQVMTRARQSGEPQTGEGRISSSINGMAVSFDLRLTCTPSPYPDNDFYLLLIEDISDEKHKERMENAFFHDIANTTSGILHITSKIERRRPEAPEELIDMLVGQCRSLSDEIQAQRELLAAESKKLTTSFREYDLRELLESEIESFSSRYEDRTFELDPSSVFPVFNTDIRLVRRVLVNLLKNAAEAGREGEVIAGCGESDGELVLWVRNPEVMSDEVCNQIFQRSFSTKGTGRGIGTYSVKLLSENYLNGSVDFTSHSTVGTIFKIRLPLTAH